MPLADDIHEAITDRAVLLERAKSGMTQRIHSMLRDLERDLVADLAKMDVTGVGTAYQRARLEKLLIQTRKTIRANYGRIKVEHASDLRQTARDQSVYVLNEINAQIGVDLLSVGLSPEQIRSIASKVLVEGAPSREWWNRQAVSLQRRFEDEVRQGMLRGEPTGKIIQRVRGTRAAGYADGIGLRTKYAREAEAIVRTSVQTVANDASMATYGNNTDVVRGLQWVSTLDNRTTTICMALHGKVWNYKPDGSLKPIGHDKEFPGPTAHWNCRSTQVPVVKSYEELMRPGSVATGGRPTTVEKVFDRQLASEGYTAGQIRTAKAGARASMDGYVPRDISFDAWLKKKGTAFQNSMLGKGRAELWRTGKISLSDLITQKGRPLSLAELAKITGTTQQKTIASLIAKGGSTMGPTA